MNTFTIDGSWNQIKGKLLQKFAQLTDDDLSFIEGKGEELFGRLQTKLGMGKDELFEMLEELKSTLHGSALRQKVEQAKSKVAEITEDLRNKASHIADDIKVSASLKAGQLKAQAGDVYINARQRANTLHESMNKQVRQKPRQSVLAALAAGFVLGLLVRR